MKKVLALTTALLAVELVAYWLFVKATDFTLPGDGFGCVVGAFMTYIAYVISIAVAVKRDW